MDSHKYMAFMIKIVEDFGLLDNLEQEQDKEGVWMPVMYPFGSPTAKSCAIRFKTEDMALEAMWELRSNGTIEYHGEGEVRNIRVVSGYSNRTENQKTAEFQFRKMRSSIKYHEVPEKTWHTDWKNQQTWYLPEGKWSERVCIARWNPKTWKI